MSATLVLKSLPLVTVTTSGTAVPLSATDIDKVVMIYISCPAANTGNIMVGDSTVEAASGLSGMEISKGQVPLVIGSPNHYVDLKNIYVDALNSGDKCKVSYLQVV